ncbi:HlyD family type I secretion periplasmic adaptor subunit [Thalassomonas actiniarum]|uniref:Membrane fusion protein (MFP) family protein n=1 Tax=Thalassomonas actiniarum TaxID=485447 RepID=A0AAE9YYA4_9GAMM|nr:HlyD family type I secretion periplasmic adaptor subunit [Thalassomonas actiniarum]WDE02584.1 HlyD family type I secretion periplasmic adaptor subunit [Thalassomonas actiniarum]
MQNNKTLPEGNLQENALKKKKGGGKQALEKLQFLPAALEIQAAPPAKWSRSQLWAIMCLLMLAIVWASWAEIDIIATAQGKIVPNGQVKVIQPLESGVVKNIFVKEGQKVQAGDKLIAIDATTSQADVDRLKNEWIGYSQDLTRQRIFLSKLDEQNARNTAKNQDNSKGDNAAFNDDDLPLNQRLLLASSWQEYLSKQDSYISEITKLIAEKKAIHINVFRIEKTLPLIREREQSYLTLLTTSAVSKNQYLELKQQRIEQEESLNFERANIEQIDASIMSARQSLVTYLAETRRNTLQEINQLSRQRDSLQQELNKANKLTQLRILTAPVDGTVEQLAVTTIGGVVTQAQELLYVVPAGRQLEVEAGLLNKDIGFVHEGQTAEIKVDSFPFTKYGVIDGKVIDISADAVEDENLGLLFPLKTSLATEQINVDGKWVQLKPGMSVTVEIKTGTRRLIEFLLAPLIRGVSEGVRER